MSVQQPLAQLDCNPWPYIQQTGYLSLHCDITGPQRDELSYVIIAWFMHRRDREPVMSNATQIHLGTQRNSGPTSSADKLNGMKRVNFTLRINNVTSADVGCYWCRIEVQRSGCPVMVFQSSTFCLCAVEVYSNLSTCTVLPGNGTPVCGGNSSCSTQTMNDTTLVSKNSTLASQTAVQSALSPAAITSVYSAAPSLSLAQLRSSAVVIGTLHPVHTAALSYFLESNAAPSTVPAFTVIPMVPEPDSSTLQVALYAVVLVIILVILCFIAAVTIVILYRKTGSHAKFKTGGNYTCFGIYKCASHIAT